LADTGASVVIGLSAVIVAAEDDAASVLVARDAGGAFALPSGPFDPTADRTFELAVRAFARTQTGFEMGYVEQLYTFGDRGRESPRADMGASAAADARVVSVGYLALTPSKPAASAGAVWRDWYDFFPWEDHRGGRPEMIEASIAPQLAAWATGAREPDAAAARVRLLFGLDGAPWNEERALDRYELLYEAGLVAEAARDRTGAASAGPGLAMASDHRRILATALGRLRAKIKYRPVVFELMPKTFTLSALQRVVEAIVGLTLHKQNFRRAIERTGVLEDAGARTTDTGGRPAALFRVREGVIRQPAASGIGIPARRG
jgi:hypothetical protein